MNNLDKLSDREFDQLLKQYQATVKFVEGADGHQEPNRQADQSH